jgi:hypothetical protein
VPEAVTLKYCTIHFYDWGCVTRFPDGSECPSIPHNAPHYFVIAHRCGYGDDILRYCHEHDLAHALIEEAVHDRPSFVLASLAHGETPSAELCLYEELAAQTLQRWARANERPIIGGIDWDALRTRFLALLA